MNNDIGENRDCVFSISTDLPRSAHLDDFGPDTKSVELTINVPAPKLSFNMDG